MCLYELVRDDTVARDANLTAADSAAPLAGSASAATLERITANLADALRASGYLRPEGSSAAEEKIRRLVHRLGLKEGDAELLIGMLRQILWKLRHF